MNSPSPFDDQVDALLRSPPAALPDAGFSDRVLAALPPPAVAPSARLRAVFVGAGTIAGLGLFLLGGPDGAALFGTLPPLAAALASIVEPFANPYVITALALAAGSLALAFQAEIRERLLD